MAAVDEVEMLRKKSYSWIRQEAWKTAVLFLYCRLLFRKQNIVSLTNGTEQLFRNNRECIPIPE